MSLPIPNLDQRSFQDLVDQAKRMIPQYTPEWTDHNVSDPGVTLIELFAWMTDLLLYQVNQVPDKLYITFLDLLGVKLAPPRAAQVPITFYLSAPQPVELTIPGDTEVATVRTETNDAIIFTTAEALTIRPPVLQGAYTRSARGGNNPTAWTIHDLRRLGLPGVTIPLFPNPPAPNDAFYIALERDHSHHVLALLLECEQAGGAGIDPTNPPVVWEAWQSGAARWVRCEVEYDGTGGFNQPGEVIIHTSPMESTTIQNIEAFWLRCRLTEQQANTGNAYRVSPTIHSISVESRGGTASARHAITVTDELLGRSDGTPGQRFQLLQTPLLARDPQRDHLIVEPPGGTAQTWQEVADFADSGPEDRHYTLNELDGTLTLGPMLLQPDGKVYRFGVVPEQGSVLRFSRYQYGGGTTGNVPQGAISVLKSSIPYVARVINRAGAVGGRDAQSIEDAKLRAPQILRTRTRAVTADDYVHLAEQVPGIARAYCLTPSAQPGGEGDVQPGSVLMLALPEVDEPDALNSPTQLALTAELRAKLLAYLNERAVVGVRIDVQQPQLIAVAAEVRLRLNDPTNPQLGEQVQRACVAALNRYLNPYVGGPRGDGWPLGRDLLVSELYGVLQRVPGVEFVEEIQVKIADPLRRNAAPVNRRVDVGRRAVICSDQHQITVES
jgi:predicted phage baseplate assembly protein